MRADLHCHSTASQLSKLGVQRALGLPECATPPQEVLELALARGMDFVTITDHDTIAGVLEIAHDPRVFVSVELTCWFREEPQAVHVLIYGITPDQFADLQAVSNCVESVAEYLHEHEIACALAHPFYAVEAPLTPRHRRRLAQLFPVWEVRNGSRAKELNLPAFVYVETHGGTGIGGSDDHAGVDIGRTWTETPRADTPAEFLAHLRAGRAKAGGDQGSAAKWAHAAMALAVRSLDHDSDAHAHEAPDPAAVFTIVDRIMREGEARRGAMGADLEPADARALLRAWLDAVNLGHLSSADLLAAMQDPEFRHRDLFRRARRTHERKLAQCVEDVVDGLGRHGAKGLAPVAAQLFDALVPAIPYVPAAAFLGKEKGKVAPAREDEPRRVALVADGVGGMHGVTHTLQELRHRGVPGFEVEIVSTDLIADRRMSAVAEVEIPFYAGLNVGVPSLPAIVEALAEGRYDLVHLCSPGPAGVAALMTARVMDLPVLGSYHTELGAYAGLRSADPMLEAFAQGAMAMFYSQCEVVLSPSEASDDVLNGLGIESERVGRWDRGVDLTRFDPARRVRDRDGGDGDGRIDVLYAGRLTREKGADLLADAFLAAHARDPRLHLVLAGGGPEEEALRERVGAQATFLGWLEGDALADAYANADLFLFASRTDTFGQVLLEAQASGLPVVAVAEGGPCSIVADGETGLLRAPDVTALADAVVALAAAPDERARLAANARAAVAERTWDRALERLADGYRRALGEGVATAAAETEARRVA
ncbi:glycosyltransferase [Baekduia sp. Peel2402]|uniref:glycosyltransferase n=1 Tax=Baekduia sp. Peel2402 TaxID=3458296 RepID=UPI00403E9664